MPPLATVGGQPLGQSCSPRGLMINRSKSAGAALGVDGTHTSWKINDPGVVVVCGTLKDCVDRLFNDCPSVKPDTSGVARMAFCSSVECAFPAVGSIKVV